MASLAFIVPPPFIGYPGLLQAGPVYLGYRVNKNIYGAI